MNKPRHRPLQRQPLKQRQRRFFIYRWHRRLGIAASLLVILLALTGVALNHTGSFGLASHYPQSSLMLWPYASVLPQAQQFESPQGLLKVVEENLELNGQPLVECTQLLNVAQINSGWWVACADQWYQFDAQWQWLDSLDPALIGVDSDATIAGEQEALLVSIENDWQLVDAPMMQLLPLSSLPTLDTQVSKDKISPIVLSKMPGENRVITWQRVVLDIHSGRWFGSFFGVNWGVWMMDAAALVLLLLALSGLWMWRSKKR
ncbi:MAG: PepSY domain-containing protein [Oleibacter sp.]|nr:PepSY domain-containing protein [Thalassolituus sp.]